MNGIKLEQNIPIPDRRPARIYPFRKMKVGDSFFVADISLVRIHAAARKYKDLRVTCRTLVENGVKGVRVWRIS